MSGAWHSNDVIHGSKILLAVIRRSSSSEVKGLPETPPLFNNPDAKRPSACHCELVQAPRSLRSTSLPRVLCLMRSSGYLGARFWSQRLVMDKTPHYLCLVRRNKNRTTRWVLSFACIAPTITWEPTSAALVVAPTATMPTAQLLHG